MRWKELFKIDKTRAVWFFISIPLSLFLSLMLFLLIEYNFDIHTPIWFYLIFSFFVCYFIGFLVDELHLSLEKPHHKTIMIIIKGFVAFVSIILLIIFFLGLYSMTQMTVMKPAVYLYPEQDMMMSVKIDMNGAITKDIPPYNDGWNVFVTKDGVIDGQYDYLFYEGDLNNVDIPDKGWVVAYDDLEQWFDTNLALMGMNEKETADFKEFWLEMLEPVPYYEIKLLSNEYLEENMNLIISPEPDTLIRLNFLFRPMEKSIEITEPVIVTPVRNGFVAVEWGGILND
ncbi:hypothetical protein ACFL96_17290 [Thermoproteota archaeon]